MNCKQNTYLVIKLNPKVHCNWKQVGYIKAGKVRSKVIVLYKWIRSQKYEAVNSDSLKRLK